MAEPESALRRGLKPHFLLFLGSLLVFFGPNEPIFLGLAGMVSFWNHEVR